MPAPLLLLLTVLLALLQGRVRGDDASTLQTIYQRLSSPAGLGWNFSSDLCTLRGVYCASPSSAVIVGLHLSDMGLSSPIPTELGNLAHLQELRLDGNLFSGPLPTELAQSPLKLLDVSYNRLSGPLPTELGTLSSLEILRLSSNKFDGGLPTHLGMLGSLRSLIAPFNGFQGSLPTELCSLASLKELHLFSNQLEGSLPAQLGALSRLELLNVGENQLRSTVPEELGGLALLQILNLARNSFEGTLPTHLGSLPRLQDLDASFNSFSGTIPTQLALLDTLSTLSLESNSLVGTLPEGLGRIDSLQSLNVRDNLLSGTVPSSLGREPRVILYLGGSNLFCPKVDYSAWASSQDFEAAEDCEMCPEDPALSPCRNGGECREGEASFRCTCPAGFSGKTCSQPGSLALPIGAIIGIVLGGLALLVALGLLFACRSRLHHVLRLGKRARKGKVGSDPDADRSSSELGTLPLSSAPISPVTRFLTRHSKHSKQATPRSQHEGEITLKNQGMEISVPGFLLVNHTQFRKEEILAKGGGGAIYQGVLLDKELKEHFGFELIAVKEVYHSNERSDRENDELFNQEIAIMFTLHKSPHIVRLVGFSLAPKMILTKRYSTDLRKLIHASQSDSTDFSLVHRVQIAHQIVVGMKSMHLSGFVHRDLKSANVLLDRAEKEGWDAFICDFGLTRVIGQPQIRNQVFHDLPGMSPRYTAPEVFDRVRSGRTEDPEREKKGDVFSFGVILWEMLTLGQLWKGCSPEVIEERVMRGERESLEPLRRREDFAEFAEIIKMCWAHNPEERPGFAFLESKLSHLQEKLLPEHPQH